MPNKTSTTEDTTQLPDDLSPLSPEEEAVLNEELQKEAQTPDAPDVKTEVLPTMKQMRALLERPIPPRLLKTMKNYGGTGTITYLHWTTVKKFLDLRSPGWEYTITHVVTTEIGV